MLVSPTYARVIRRIKQRPRVSTTTADHWQVDRGVIMRIRTVAKEGALEALSKSRPGRREKKRDMELLAARADAARLGDALKEMAVKLMLVEGKGRWG